MVTANPNGKLKIEVSEMVKAANPNICFILNIPPHMCARLEMQREFELTVDHILTVPYRGEM